MDFKGFISARKSKDLQSQAEVGWNTLQKLCAAVLRSSFGETAICCLVVLSFILMVMEADYGSDVPSWLRLSDVVLMAIYAAEMIVRVFIFRIWFFASILNMLDLLVTVIEVSSHVLILTSESAGVVPSIVALRAVRMLRLARGYKVISKFPQLALMVKGLISGVTASLYGAALLLVIVAVWSVFAVQILDPINQKVNLKGVYTTCERCPYAFSDVRSSMITFTQQIIAGDSWGLVTIPIIEEAPETAIFFTLVFVSVHFTIMNVILAVIVDSAAKASQEDVGEMLKHKLKQVEKAQAYLYQICQEMDANGSGDLTENEIMCGYEANDDFREILLSMDINKEDMSMVYKILDADGSGLVSYKEFITELFKMKQHDSHTLLVIIKHYATEIRTNVKEQLDLLKQNMTAQVREILAEERQGFVKSLPLEIKDQEKTAANLGDDLVTTVKEVLNRWQLPEAGPDVATWRASKESRSDPLSAWGGCWGGQLARDYVRDSRSEGRTPIIVDSKDPKQQQQQRSVVVQQHTRRSTASSRHDSFASRPSTRHITAVSSTPSAAGFSIVDAVQSPPSIWSMRTCPRPERQEAAAHEKWARGKDGGSDMRCGLRESGVVGPRASSKLSRGEENSSIFAAKISTGPSTAGSQPHLVTGLTSEAECSQKSSSSKRGSLFDSLSHMGLSHTGLR